MKSILLFLALSSSLAAQLVDLGQRTTPGLSAVTPRVFHGSGAPGSVTGNLPGDVYIDDTNHIAYECLAASGTAAPACTSVIVGAWGTSVSPGSVNPTTGAYTTPSSISSGSGSGLTGNLALTSATSGSVVNFTTFDNAASGVSLFARGNGGGTRRLALDSLLTGGNVTCGIPMADWAVAGDTVVSGTNKFYAPGQALGGTPALLRTQNVPGVIGQSSVWQIGCLTLVMSASEATGTLTCTLFVNGVTTALTVNVPNGSAGWTGAGTGTFQDATHFISVNAGDLVNTQCVQSTGTSGGIANLSWSIQ